METQLEVDFGKIKISGIKEVLPFNLIKRKQHPKGTFVTLWAHLKGIDPEKRPTIIKKMRKSGIEVNPMSNRDVVSLEFRSEDMVNIIKSMRFKRIVTTTNANNTQKNIRMHFLNTGEMPEYIQKTVPANIKFPAYKKSNN